MPLTSVGPPAAFGLAMFLNVLHRASGAPLAPVVATWAVFAVAFLVIVMHLLWRSAQVDFRAESAVAAGARLPWLRVVLWPIAVAVAIALVTGYVGLAVFLAVRLLAALAIGGALTIVLVFVDAFTTEVIAADTPRGRRIAALFGISPNALDLVAALVSAVAAAGPDRGRGAAAGRLFRPVRRGHLRRVPDLELEFRARRHQPVADQLARRARHTPRRIAGDSRRPALAARPSSCRAPASMPACRIRSRRCRATSPWWPCWRWRWARSGSTCRRSR